MTKGLYDHNAVWCTEDNDLERIVLEYFGELFQSSCPSNLDVFTDLFSAVVTHDINAILTREFETAEVFQALKQMQLLQAPGPDGFTLVSIKTFGLWSAKTSLGR